MPGVQSPAFGASQRLAVFPGLEERAIMQLPGGQSGHPLSPHYLDLLHDWSNGGLTPLVSGPADQVLRIIGSG
jgi:penicillin G amidase